MNEPITWDVPEYEPKERSVDWFWALGIATLAIAITAIILGDTLFGVLIITAAIAIGTHAMHPPRILHVEIGERGIRVSNTLYPYDTLESFWVEEHDLPSRILIKSEKLLMPYIIIPLGGEDPSFIRQALQTRLPEAFHAEPIFQKLLEIVGL